jgi:catechol 2,3-dioxygenase-like lactoylglutathione lyase family enzyme
LANQTGRPIAPARKLVAAVMGTIAVFVVALGLGMSSWGVVVFGLAVLALSIALGMVNVVRRGARAWVTGTAEVRAISPPPSSSAVYGRAEIQAVVVAPGLPTSEVVMREPRVPVVKWPMVGDTLPITVDVDDMRRVRINWDEATPHERGEDPPLPPPVVYEDDLVDDLDNDLLGDPEPPPWAARDRQWDPSDEPPPPPPPPSAAAGNAETVVVRHTPEGTILEGELVDHDETPQPLPRRAPGAAAGAASTATRAPGTRPSPHRRGGTATATAEPGTTATATAAAPVVEDEPVTTPSQRRAPFEPEPVDLPLDEPSQRTTPVEPVDLPLDEPSPGSGPEPDLDPDRRYRRPPPTATATAATPSPTGAFPTAPDPVTPPPVAPEPATTRPAGPRPASFDDVDLPLDGDPEPAPETTEPAAVQAVHEGLIAPPVEEPPTVSQRRPVEEPEPRPVAETRSAAHGIVDSSDRPTTQFRTNPAHDEEAATKPGVVAGAAAAMGAAAASVFAAVKKVGREHREEPPPAPEPPAATPAAPAPESAAPESAAQESAGPESAGPAATVAGDAVPEKAESAAGPWTQPPTVSTEPDDRADDLITAYPSARPGPAGAIYGVGITVLVTDLARSVSFYRDTLGFYEIDNGEGSAVLASGDTRLVLRTVTDLSAAAGRLIYLNLEVGDVEAVYAELIAKGVTFQHPPQPVNRGDRLELWSATFSDPDGHNIAITQWRAIR